MARDYRGWCCQAGLPLASQRTNCLLLRSGVSGFGLTSCVIFKPFSLPLHLQHGRARPFIETLFNLHLEGDPASHAPLQAATERLQAVKETVMEAAQASLARQPRSKCANPCACASAAPVQFWQALVPMPARQVCADGWVMKGLGSHITLAT